MAKPELVTAGATRWKGNYAPVRFNAMTHGILSKLVVLAHEDHTEFDDLLEALVAEHQPTGPTERHLVEELAAIIWRKRRVLLAEGAAINRGLAMQVGRADDVIKAAAPFRDDVGSEYSNLPAYMGSPEEMAKLPAAVGECLVAARKAASILVMGGPNAYSEALAALTEDSRYWWRDRSEDHEEDYPNTADGLIRFIGDVMIPAYEQATREIPIAPAIRAQAFGSSTWSYSIEKLSPYEVHLDRKFERTLAMLIKLKEMRAG